MKKSRTLYILIGSTLLIAAAFTVYYLQPKREEPNTIDLTELAPPDTAQVSDGEAALEPEYVQQITRVRFRNFTVVFHDFQGYDVYPGDYYEDRSLNLDTSELILNENERLSEDPEYGSYLETLIARKDTVRLYEDFGSQNEEHDNRINNTLLQIIPTHKSDSFSVAVCFIEMVAEAIDDRGIHPDLLENIYKNLFNTKETSPYVSLQDSAGYYFRTSLLDPDFAIEKVTDGAISYEHNEKSPEQNRFLTDYYNRENQRIIKKYKLHDTDVVIPGEYDVEIKYAQGQKLFSFGPESFLFKITRYQKSIKKESRYIIVQMISGC